MAEKDDGLGIEKGAEVKGKKLSVIKSANIIVPMTQ